ncbi:MAG: hypothetical protein Q8O57_03805 [Kiritimatiellota bacterium]|nr:hypothetical protein [Kiritimatiellota bacterium]
MVAFLLAPLVSAGKHFADRYRQGIRQELMAGFVGMKSVKGEFSAIILNSHKARQEIRDFKSRVPGNDCLEPGMNIRIAILPGVYSYLRMGLDDNR